MKFSELSEYDQKFVREQVRRSAVWYSDGLLTFDELIRNIWFIRYWKLGWNISTNNL